MEKDIIMKRKSGWENIDDVEVKKIMVYADEYIKFLNGAKTERKFIKETIELLKKNDFLDINKVDIIKPGMKLYFNNKGKSLYATVIGSEDISLGVNIIGSHVDSPRLDLKSNPLYEEGNVAFFKTDYYGGIKKYQWTSIPLSLHGVIIKLNGDKIEISVGENDEEPVFTITDLLPHLAKNQMSKTLREGIEGEHLNAVIGNMPCDLGEDKVKYNVLKLLNEKYGIIEEDFNSAELELVPAFKARNLGFDNSMIAGYGQDDRVCAYASLSALISLSDVSKTAVCIFSDKEEVGSMGNTGMESNIFNYFMSEILNKMNINKPNLLDKIFFNSKMLSSDVEAAYDPNFDAVFEKSNTGFLSHGIALTKYTGSAGKSNGSDANAEYLAYIRKLLEENKIKYQLSKLGKSDIGGGGTIAYVLANKGVEVIDCGVAVLSMHSPYEIISKFDLYELYKFNKIFWQN